MKFWLGMGMVVLGILAGLFVGLYVMFFGGVVQVLRALSPLHAEGVALGFFA